MLDGAPGLEVRLAQGAAERRAAQRLRYEVFVAERGGDGPGVDHAARLESDAFDAGADHLILVDPTRPADRSVVGTCRLIDSAGGRFCAEAEFDLAPLRASGRRLLELGRICLAPDCRGGAPLWQMWSGLAALVEARGVEIVFGTASFPGADPTPHLAALQLLFEAHLAPPALRPASRAPVPVPAGPPADRPAAARAVPPLIKSYLRLGGAVGAGAWIDRDFGTLDVCMVLDTAAMPARARALLGVHPG
ncbi:GNAT family N-acetyltransferase [Wenxinia saemankumensis]|uniref:L-ornithine N(alpha)-acyltransferase n=1 Tax=Wenxinia saemankumensis TaxID=1447782 RepID=A0A1M6HIT1_9RHOB|nr:GNAT family N-acyltransferase [Wenxinia saemankumensis]SHJ22100.1 ornithine-acyl[acyl carrier protein] N-acyltransferase [Wenxinia saemankumensis]